MVVENRLAGRVLVIQAPGFFRVKEEIIMDECHGGSFLRSASPPTPRRGVPCYEIVRSIAIAISPGIG